MKKVFSVFLALWITTIGIASAANNKIEVVKESSQDLFVVDEQTLNDFAALEAIEMSIMESGLSDYKTITNANSELQLELANMEINSVNSINATNGFTMDNMDWGSFAWGLLCCPIGFFVVAINKNKSQDQKSSFWIGWGVGVVINLIYGAATGFEGYGYSSSSNP